MPDTEDIADAIANAAVDPQSASVDGNSVTKRSADDLLKLADRANGTQSTTRPGFGLRFQKITPVYE